MFWGVLLILATVTVVCVLSILMAGKPPSVNLESGDPDADPIDRFVAEANRRESRDEPATPAFLPLSVPPIAPPAAPAVAKPSRLAIPATQATPDTPKNPPSPEPPQRTPDFAVEHLATFPSRENSLRAGGMPKNENFPGMNGSLRRPSNSPNSSRVLKQVAALLRNRETLASAFVLREIFDAPLSQRQRAVRK